MSSHGHIWIERGGRVRPFSVLCDDSHWGPRCSKCGYEFCYVCEDTPRYSCKIALLITMEKMYKEYGLFEYIA